MPDFTISLTDAQVQRLQAKVAQFNEQNKRTLTVRQYIILKVRMLTIDAQAQARRYDELNAQKDEEVMQKMHDEFGVGSPEIGDLG